MLVPALSIMTRGQSAKRDRARLGTAGVVAEVIPLTVTPSWDSGERQFEGEYMIEVNQFLSANARYSRTFAAGALGVQPTRQLAVVTCMDSRYTAQGVLGLNLGEAHVIRNAGGRVTSDVLRSLILSAAALGTRQCVIIHHTGCGLYGQTNTALRDRVAEVTGERPEVDFLVFDDLEHSVREDVAAVRSCVHLPPNYDVVGFVYDVQTGMLRLVTDGTI